MANTFDGIKSQIIHEHGRPDVSVADGILDNLKYYQDKVNKTNTAGANVGSGTIAHDFETKLTDAAEKLKESRKTAEEASEYLKETAERAVVRDERALEKLVTTHRRDFEALVKRNNESIKTLTEESAKQWERFERNTAKEIEGLGKAIEKAGKTGGTVNHGPLNNASIEQAEKALENMGKKLTEARTEYESVVKKALDKHESIATSLNHIAEDVKTHSGHDLMSGLSTAEKELATVGGDVAKGAGKGKGVPWKKVGSTGLGAVVGYYIGKMVGGEDSTIAPLVGAGAGGAGGYAIAQKLLSGAAHVR